MEKQHKVDEEERFAQLIGLAGRDLPEPAPGLFKSLRDESTSIFTYAVRAGTSDNGMNSRARSRRFRWMAPIAAGLLVLAGLAFWPFRGPTPMPYAFADVAEQLRQAKSLHWRWTMVEAFGSAEDRKFEYLTRERWDDLESGRYRERAVGTARQDDGELVNDIEVIDDGEFILGIYYSDRHAIYWRKSPLQREVDRKRRANQFMRETGLYDPKQLATFKRVEQVVIEGEVYDLWAGTIPKPSYGSGDHTVNAWLHPESGALRRLETQATDQGQGSMGFQRSTYELIEQDVAMPDELFSTDFDPPLGFVLKNTKVTAEIGRYYNGFGNGLFNVNLILTLPDGCLIVGWSYSVRGKTAVQVDQAAVFAALVVGGPLPELPQVVSGVKTIGVAGEEVRFLGRHLATTQLDGQLYEWSLFVPERPVPPADQFFGYTFRYGKVSDDPREEKLRDTDADSFVLESDDEFNIFVRGAMAEHADDAKAPTHVTPEAARQLAEQIRSTVASSSLP